MKFYYKKTLVLSFFLMIISPTYGYIGDYTPTKAQLPLPETRLEKTWLSSIDINLHGGSTTKARDYKGNTQELLNVYGYHNMHLLGKGVPSLKDTDDVIKNLFNITPTTDDFGKLEYKGTYESLGVSINFTQNFCKGFFGQIHLPFVSEKVSSISYTDKTSSSDPGYITWKRFLNKFDTVMTQNDIDTGNSTYTGLNDAAVFVGWTYNNDDTEILDFFDATIKFGCLLPSSQQKNIDETFSIPSGTNNHIGLPASFDIAIGGYDWVTLGLHGSALFLFQKTKEMRVKTNAEQNGFIKLAKSNTTVDAGTVWTLGTYVKAERFIKGLSCTIGYSGTIKRPDVLTPETTVSTATIASSDKAYTGWEKHTVHFGLDYGFEDPERRWSPHIGFSYNRIFSGTHVFDNHLWGGNFGVVIALDF